MKFIWSCHVSTLPCCVTTCSPVTNRGCDPRRSNIIQWMDFQWQLSSCVCFFFYIYIYTVKHSRGQCHNVNMETDSSTVGQIISFFLLLPLPAWKVIICKWITFSLNLRKNKITPKSKFGKFWPFFPTYAIKASTWVQLKSHQEQWWHRSGDAHRLSPDFSCSKNHCSRVNYVTHQRAHRTAEGCQRRQPPCENTKKHLFILH